MSQPGAADADAPDGPAQRAILLFAIVSGLLLLVAHEALEAEAAWFDGRLTRCLWFTLAGAWPLFAALSVQRLADRRYWLGVAAYALLLGYLAFYSGRAMEPRSVAVDAVALPYVWTLIASGHVLGAWFAVALRRQGFGYPLLFEAAWRMVSTLAQVVAYTGAFWLLLWLWAALFKALGIEFFHELFALPRFIYPVTSLVVGYGLVLARTKSSLGDAVHLRVLALWRGLLPLAAVLALAFASALLLRGVEPLWATRHATQLLLALVFALVALANAAYGKGGEAAPHPALRWLVTAALALLPLFVALAAWALGLRWRQYGLSLDRLWAALLVFIAALYGFGYAVAALRRAPVWLAGIAPVNRAASLIGAGLLLLTQTGALDFRAITAHTLLARGAALNDEDLRYLRWELGHPGLYALERLQAEGAPATQARIAELLSKQHRYDPDRIDSGGPVVWRQPPTQPAAPEALVRAAAQFRDEFDRGQGEPCGAPAECWLLQASLVRDQAPVWLRVRLLSRPAGGRIELSLFRPCGEQWCADDTRSEPLSADQMEALRAALASGDFAVEPPKLSDYRIGARRFRFPLPGPDAQ
ncbi:DUF4153 domain-containing protein [Stagnimonas aquatica]|uniref:DUF4153 domain-containing protein n=1 Tax=Stagnimonas aquatica TaxID=2689987 RepID=A0A3N0VM00_9GAMM|nr:DUF4153 domain-containing protein [Stagnimonas aquatica]ROH93789.1 DUF4153 domain-containing protein [Stagnimonas aquatica]